MVLVDKEFLINFPIRRHHLKLSGKDKIPLDENLLFREILLKSVGENMERYFLHHNDTPKRFNYQVGISEHVSLLLSGTRYGGCHFYRS